MDLLPADIRRRAGARTPLIVSSLLAALIATTSSDPAGAGSFDWTGGGGDQQFTNPANWTPAGVPGALDTAQFTTAFAGGSADVVVTAAAPGGTVEVGTIRIDRVRTTFSGDALGLNGTEGVSLGLNHITVIGVDVTFQNDLVLRSSGIIEIIQLLGPVVLVLCGDISDGGGGHGLTLRPSSANVIRLDGNNTYSGGTTVETSNIQGTVWGTRSTALGSGPMTVAGDATLLLSAPDIANDIDIADGVTL